MQRSGMRPGTQRNDLPRSGTDYSSPRLRGGGHGGEADEASPKGEGEGLSTPVLDRRQPLTLAPLTLRLPRPRQGGRGPLPASGERWARRTHGADPAIRSRHASGTDSSSPRLRGEGLGGEADEASPKGEGE